MVRYGAFGDHIIVTPLLRLLKEDGYHVTYEVAFRGREMLRGNPYIDEFIDHDETIPNDKLSGYWDELKKGYDRFVNLSGSVEEGLLAPEGSREFYLSKDERHRRYNKNYYDYTLELAGYDVKGLRGELYFDEDEENIAKAFRKKHRDKFLVVWALSGSAFHKAYPYAEYVADAFLSKRKNAVIVTVGGEIERIIEFNLKNTIKTCGKWSFRRSALLTKHADLVIGGETGIMHAAGCYDTPKILMLSHSTVENLSKYWKGCINLSPDVSCHPCHRLIYTLKPCPKDFLGEGDKLGIPICVSRLNAGDVLDAMKGVYEKWATT